MAKHYHEIRDPMHIFIRLDTDERKVLNSRPFQRLRHIHQLALTYLVYPSATHRRFEHSLGVMELAGRVYDIITKPENVLPNVTETITEFTRDDERGYWRKIVRMAALCHDIGHLPFSHGAEEALLPNGWNHERITVELIRSPEMRNIWENMTPPLRTEHVVKIAVGKKELSKFEPEIAFTNWESILSEIIVGDAFGVDRIDYLLRDSHHAGVAYGKFDHYRLIDTIRILPKAEESSIEPVLGIEDGGLHTAESLLLARYYMYSQLYFHPVRRIYDIHLQDFLKEDLVDGFFSTDCEEHLRVTDNEITSNLLEAARNNAHRGHESARRIVERDHFRLLYKRNPNDVRKNPEAAVAIFNTLSEEFGAETARMDVWKQGATGLNFPVLQKDGRIVSSVLTSENLKNVPLVAVDFVFVAVEVLENARKWLEKNLESIITLKEEGEL